MENVITLVGIRICEQQICYQKERGGKTERKKEEKNQTAVI
jgi:hypothetical protein